TAARVRIIHPPKGVFRWGKVSQLQSNPTITTLVTVTRETKERSIINYVGIAIIQSQRRT
ncbi:hypothetical protein, partial [Loktanella sp. S4079]|uniref:hypothetical protein n=1 Tax=Loktanella sp. S4079 TaxID=579483 RepID=UPI000B073FE0